MKALKTLLKVRKYEVDQTLNNIKKLENELEDTKKTLKQLEEDEKQEIVKCSKAQFFAALESYLKYNREQQAEHQKQILYIENRIFTERHKLSDQFNEMKKVETLIADQNAKAKTIASKKEISQQDESNIMKYGNKST